MRVDGTHIPAAALNHMGGNGKAGTQGAPADSGADAGVDTDTTPTPPAAGTAFGAVPPLSGATAVAAQLAAQGLGSQGEGNPATIGKVSYAANPDGYKNLGQAVSEAAHELNADSEPAPAPAVDETSEETASEDETTSDETASEEQTASEEDTASDTTDTADGGDTTGGGETTSGDEAAIVADLPAPDPAILDQVLLDAMDEASDGETAGDDVIDILPDMPAPDPAILDQALLDAMDEASDPEIT